MILSQKQTAGAPHGGPYSALPHSHSQQHLPHPHQPSPLPPQQQQRRPDPQARPGGNPAAHLDPLRQSLYGGGSTSSRMQLTP
jgi:hypothetical protein